MIKVMIADDEPFIRQGLKILIDWEQYGFKICGEASNGKEAVELMKENDYDLIITDIKMPLMDGLELIEYTRMHISKKTRFIILSGFYEFDYAKKAIKNEVADYVLKPVQKEELIKALEDYKEYIRQAENQKALEYSGLKLLDHYLIDLMEEKPGDINKSAGADRQLVNKELMDGLIRAIEEYDTDEINSRIDIIYEHFKNLVTEPVMIKINLDYLIFNMINIAKDLNPYFRQDEIYKKISERDYERIAVLGGAKYFKEFILEFSEYLCKLRHTAFGGVLKEIEKEITEHYMDSLTVKAMSEKYYINSAYLGQIFKKQYGNTFKEYLNAYRIDRAAELLVRSDEKIYLVANAVGFNNADYFISRFVQLKGITPFQYRKQSIRKHRR
jgi:YesN/AraC family two-component response regulator